MLTRIDLRGRTTDLRAVLARRNLMAAAADTVAEIIDAVRSRGDAAVQELTERFDGCRLDSPLVPQADIDAALGRLDPDLGVALEFARDQILAWHEAQREREAKHERAGVEVRELVLPVDRAGCYVPGGRAAYASSVLMTALPARIAGVPWVALCVPPDHTGAPPTSTLAAAALSGVDAVFRIGGAQA